MLFIIVYYVIARLPGMVCVGLHDPLIIQPGIKMMDEMPAK